MLAPTQRWLAESLDLESRTALLAIAARLAVVDNQLFQAERLYYVVDYGHVHPSLDLKKAKSQ